MANEIKSNTSTKTNAGGLIGGGTAVLAVGAALYTTADGSNGLSIGGILLFIVGAAIIISGLIAKNKQS